MIKDFLPAGAFFILQLYTVLVASYFLLTSIAGLIKPKKLPEVEPTKRFLLLIPAHNEASVIGSIVDNLLKLDYPQHLYDIVVIADGCSDKTALKVQQKGLVPLIHNYQSDEVKGKPMAIAYALKSLPNYEEDYDGVCIFDADNLVSFNFLKEMNKHFMAGQQLVQCYLDTKNPMDNWVSLSFATNFYYMNRSYQLSRSHLKLPASLGGTGFCMGTKLLKKIGWTATSLTEDLEFQIQSVLGGERAYWCHTARVYDEKPTSFKASCEQRSRWARGHWSLVFKYAPDLLTKAIKEKSIVAFDTLFYTLNPLHILVSAIALVYSLIAYSVGYNLPTIMPGIIFNLLLIVPFAFVIFSIITDVKKPAPKLFGAILINLFNLTYIPIVVWALITHKNKAWKRTEHSRNVILDLSEETKIK